MHVPDTDWETGVREMSKWTFIDKLKMVTCTEIITYNSTEDIQDLEIIVKNRLFTSFAIGLINHDLRYLCEWLIEITKRVLKKVKIASKKKGRYYESRSN